LIDVYGRIVVEGTSDLSIVFDWVDSGNYWAGFRFDSTSLDTAAIKYI